MIRGIERRNIFKDNKDRDNLIERVALLLPETQTTCYAWVLMPNHAHFLFRSGNVGLSMRIPHHSGHPFHTIPAGDSTANRPPI
jgi:REP element-mobilizing transposase RayT